MGHLAMFGDIFYCHGVQLAVEAINILHLQGLPL